jgi:hypothetical protein
VLAAGERELGLVDLLARVDLELVLLEARLLLERLDRGLRLARRAAEQGADLGQHRLRLEVVGVELERARELLLGGLELHALLLLAGALQVGLHQEALLLLGEREQLGLLRRVVPGVPPGCRWAAGWPAAGALPPRGRHGLGLLLPDEHEALNAMNRPSRGTAILILTLLGSRGTEWEGAESVRISARAPG